MNEEQDEKRLEIIRALVGSGLGADFVYWGTRPSDEVIEAVSASFPGLIDEVWPRRWWDQAE